MHDKIRKFALLNASRYNGKANPGSVISKLLGEHPELKTQMKDVAQDVKKIIAEIEKLSVEQMIEELKRTAPELLEEKKEEKPKGLPDLPNAKEGHVITRIPPEPSKYIHLGHALAFYVSYLLAEKYTGKTILRFEDTNPEKSTQEYVNSIREDIAWLGIKPSSEFIVSDHMDKLYKAAEKLIAAGHAYACCCDQESMRSLREKKHECKHTKHAAAENLNLWKQMLDRKFKEGEMCLRLKGDMNSHNGVMRDPVIFRLDFNKHYRQGDKYAVWPLYDFANVFSDETNGVTHVTRSAEFVLRGELHDYLRKVLGYRSLTMFEFGRFNVIGTTTKGRELRELIEKGEMIGWDDPRLVTIKALRRRGVRPEALREIVYEVGFKKDQANIDWTMIASINRKMIDPTTNRYFFVKDPVEITIAGAPRKIVHLPKHPDHKDRGSRTLQTSGKFYISKEDSDELKQRKLYRLMDCVNFKKTTKGFVFDSETVDVYREKGEKNMHWLPADAKDLTRVSVMMPDATVVHGFGEPALQEVKVNDVIQFERFGFCRLDAITKGEYQFWYTHK